MRRTIDSVDIARWWEWRAAPSARFSTGIRTWRPAPGSGSSRRSAPTSTTPTTPPRCSPVSDTDTLGLFFFNAGHFSEDVLADFLISSVIENAAAVGYHTLAYVIRPDDEPPAGRSRRRSTSAGSRPAFSSAPATASPSSSSSWRRATSWASSTEAPRRPEPNRVVANFDDTRTARAVIDYLASQGHRQIAIIHGDRARHAGADEVPRIPGGHEGAQPGCEGTLDGGRGFPDRRRLPGHALGPRALPKPPHRGGHRERQHRLRRHAAIASRGCASRRTSPSWASTATPSASTPARRSPRSSTTSRR